MKTTHSVFFDLEYDPLDPGQIVAGEAATADLTLAKSADASAGFWSCTPGTFTDTEVRESFLVLSGHATLTYADGTTHDLRPGSTHEFAGGEQTTWTVHEKLLKAYWIAELRGRGSAARRLGVGLAPKRDIKQFEQACRQVGLEEPERRRASNAFHAEKSARIIPTDLTYGELLKWLREWQAEWRPR